MLVKYISGIGNEGVFQPDNLNLYVYAYNNPLAYTDPSGEVAWFIPIIIGFVIGAYVGGFISRQLRAMGMGLEEIGVVR